jgi:HEAT repeat protein
MGVDPRGDKLITALGHPEPTTPVRAATILGRIQESRAVPALVAVLRTREDGFLRAAAATALGKIGDPAAVPALVEVLRGSPLVARLAAAEALGALGSEESAAALRRATTDDPTAGVRGAAAAALQRLQNRSPIRGGDAPAAEAGKMGTHGPSALPQERRGDARFTRRGDDAR